MDARWTFALVLSVIHTLTLLAVWGVFSFCFHRGLGVRFQAGGGQAPPPKLMRRAVREMVVSQLAFVVLMAFVVFPLWHARGGRMDWALPGLDIVAVHLLVFVVVQDTLFYWSHRTLHTPWFFRKVHYAHHRFVYVRGPVAEYAHPLENAANFVAFFAGPIALGTPASVMALWVCLRIIETVEAHSGYMLTPWSRRHAFHHLRASGGCYGSFFGLWDFLLGTDRQWRRWRAQQAGGG